ncbi:MAG: Bax inhibitor-1/YccA family protein [Alphaproteobacteria bacterium]|nr:Bax inhibitor-1/YccA family protein [Alphaproteobacteria bacterium]
MENRTYYRAGATSAVDEGLRQYMLKVYNFMAAGLGLTALSAYFIVNTPLLKLFFSVNQSGQYGLSGFGWLMFIAPLIMVFAFNWVVSRGSSSQAQLFFWAFSAVMGFSLAPTLLVYTGASVARVFLVTAGTFGAMSLYGYTTKRDLTALGSFLIMGLWGVIITMIVNFFLQSSGVDYALSLIALAIFIGLTAFDTQRIKNMYNNIDDSEIATKKAIVGALSLYLDFINMFIYLLRFMGDRR